MDVPPPAGQGRTLLIVAGTAMLLFGAFATLCFVLAYFLPTGLPPTQNLIVSAILVSGSFLLVLVPGIILLVAGLRRRRWP